MLSVVSVWLLSACNEQQDVSDEVRSPAASAMLASARGGFTSNLVATIGSQSFSQADIDKSIALKLYDLEWAKYELRQQALSNRIALELAHAGNKQHNDVTILMTPPEPPRLVLKGDAQPSLGPEDAPITLSVFCNYQSIHCGRIQTVYQSLLKQYPQQLRFVFYDFPQGFHRHAKSASEAARCANHEGRFEAYHQALWAQQDDLGEALYQRIATQLELDDFSQCLLSKEYRDQIAANQALAEELGFGNVPVTLVNGLYLNGPKSLEVFRYFIDQELNNLASTPREQSPQKSLEALRNTALAIRLEGVIDGGSAAAHQALIRNLASNQSQSYVQDDEILKDVYIVLIGTDRVVIENNGVLENLPLSRGSLIEQDVSAGELSQDEPLMLADTDQTQVLSTADMNDNNGNDGESEEAPVAGLEYSYRGVVDAKGETPLSRAWLQDQLSNEVELREHFQPAEHEVEGVRVMRLAEVGSSEFYQTLGMKEGDVVLRVNDEWVHEAQNNLFAQLESGEEVSVVLMRRGLPVHLRYAIQ